MWDIGLDIRKYRFPCFALAIRPASLQTKTTIARSVGSVSYLGLPGQIYLSA